MVISILYKFHSIEMRQTKVRGRKRKIEHFLANFPFVKRYNSRTVKVASPKFNCCLTLFQIFSFCFNLFWFLLLKFLFCLAFFKRAYLLVNFIIWKTNDNVCYVDEMLWSIWFSNILHNSAKTVFVRCKRVNFCGNVQSVYIATTKSTNTILHLLKITYFI